MGKFQGVMHAERPTGSRVTCGAKRNGGDQKELCHLVSRRRPPVSGPPTPTPHHDALVRAGRGHGLAHGADGLLRKKLNKRGAVGHLALGLCQGLALLRRHEASEVVYVEARKQDKEW